MWFYEIWVFSVSECNMILLCFVFVTFVFNVFYAATYLTRVFFGLKLLFFFIIFTLAMVVAHCHVGSNNFNLLGGWSHTILVYLPWYDFLCSSLKVILQFHVGSLLRLYIVEFTWFYKCHPPKKTIASAIKVRHERKSLLARL